MYTTNVAIMPIGPSRRTGVYEELRTLIVRGRLGPGARLVELDIAARLGVSRTPAREAIQRLAQDGFLKQVGQGTRSHFLVAPLTAEDCGDLYGTMGGLEGAAARNVVRLPDGERKRLANELKRLEAGFEAQAARSGMELEKLFESHNAFHEHLVVTCATPWLGSLIALTRPLVDRYEFVYAPLVGGDHKDTFEEHADIIRAVRDGSASATESAVKTNWINGGERLRAAMSRVGPRGDW
jgi:DNA-binding GntR family transcriptional regulator